MLPRLLVSRCRSIALSTLNQPIHAFSTKKQQYNPVPGWVNKLSKLGASHITKEKENAASWTGISLTEHAKEQNKILSNISYEIINFFSMQRQQLNQHEKDYQIMKDKVKLHENTISELRKEVRSYELQEINWNENQDRLNTIIEAKKDELKRLETKRQTEVGEMQTTIDTYKDDIKQLNSIKEQGDKQMTEQKQKIAELKKTTENLKNENKDLSTAVAVEETKMRQSADDIAGLQIALRDSENKRYQTEEEKYQLLLDKHQVDVKMEQVMGKYEAEAEKHIGQINAGQIQLENKEVELNMTREYYENMKKVMNELNTQKVENAKKEQKLIASNTEKSHIQEKSDLKEIHAKELLDVKEKHQKEMAQLRERWIRGEMWYRWSIYFMAVMFVLWIVTVVGTVNFMANNKIFQAGITGKSMLELYRYFFGKSENSVNIEQKNDTPNKTPNTMTNEPVEYPNPSDISIQYIAKRQLNRYFEYIYKFGLKL